MISDYIAEKKNVKGRRSHKIKDSYGLPDAFRYYQKKGGKLSNKAFTALIRAVHAKLRERLSCGENVVFPVGMGTLCLRKYKRGVWRDSEGVKNTYPVDWEATLKLWYEDKDAEERKLLVKKVVDYTYRVVYPSKKRTYLHHDKYRFKPSRALKLQIKQNIINGTVDALIQQRYEA